jgi:uncharacterized ferritin-like protein (DUF455 family)
MANAGARETVGELRAVAEPPRGGTVERWCFDFVLATRLADKLEPREPPSEWERGPVARRIPAPGRPSELTVVARSEPAPRPRALRDPAARAKLVHTFVHHELQAAELFAWAVLAFANEPREFRAGLLRLCGEELAHLRLYREHLASLGVAFGAFAVRDWFWQRVPQCASATSFVALVGLGLEGANLDHCARYVQHFRDAGDERGARILGIVERDETRHVAFAAEWFAHFTGRELDYDAWRAALPAPLTPAVLQGRPLNREARRRAGQDEAFLERLLVEPPTKLRRSP